VTGTSTVGLGLDIDSPDGLKSGTALLIRTPPSPSWPTSSASCHLDPDDDVLAVWMLLPLAR
jgi:hypothetical protein